MGIALDMLVERLAHEVRDIIGLHKPVRTTILTPFYPTKQSRYIVGALVESTNYPLDDSHRFVHPTRTGVLQPCFQGVVGQSLSLVDRCKETPIRLPRAFHSTFNGQYTHVFPVHDSHERLQAAIALTFPIRNPYPQTSPERKKETKRAVFHSIPLISHLLAHAYSRSILVISPQSTKQDAIESELQRYGFQTRATTTFEEATQLLDQRPIKNRHSFDLVLFTDGYSSDQYQGFNVLMEKNHRLIRTIHLTEEASTDHSPPNAYTFDASTLKLPSAVLNGHMRYPPLIRHLDTIIDDLDALRAQYIKGFSDAVWAEPITSSGLRENRQSLDTFLINQERYRQDVRVRLSSLLTTDLIVKPLSGEGGIARIDTPPHMDSPNLYLLRGDSHMLQNFIGICNYQRRIRRRLLAMHRAPFTDSGMLQWNVPDHKIFLGDHNPPYLVTQEAAPHDTFEELFGSRKKRRSEAIATLEKVSTSVAQFCGLLPRTFPSFSTYDAIGSMHRSVEEGIEEIKEVLNLWASTDAARAEVADASEYLSQALPVLADSLRHRFDGLQDHTIIDAFMGNYAMNDNTVYFYDLRKLRLAPLTFLAAHVFSHGNYMRGHGGLGIAAEREHVLQFSQEYNKAVRMNNALVTLYKQDPCAFLREEVRLDIESRPWLAEIAPALYAAFDSSKQASVGPDSFSASVGRTLHNIEGMLGREPYNSNPGLKDAAKNYVLTYVGDLFHSFANNLSIKEEDATPAEQQIDAYTAFVFFRSLRMVGHTLGLSRLRSMAEPFEMPHTDNVRSRTHLLRPMEPYEWKFAYDTLSHAMLVLPEFHEHDPAQRYLIGRALARIQDHIRGAYEKSIADQNAIPK